jgi:putative transposase
LLPHNPLESLAAFLPSEERRLTLTGVQIHCLQYWDDALAPWVGQRTTVRIHYDPRDITVGYVRTPVGMIVRVRVTTPGIPAISLVEWHARRDHERRLSNDPEIVAATDASLRRNDELVSQAKAKRSIRRRQATASAGDRHRAEPAPTTEAIVHRTDMAELPVMLSVPTIYSVEDDYDAY